MNIEDFGNNIGNFFSYLSPKNICAQKRLNTYIQKSAVILIELASVLKCDISSDIDYK